MVVPRTHGLKTNLTYGERCICISRIGFVNIVEHEMPEEGRKEHGRKVVKNQR